MRSYTMRGYLITVLCALIACVMLSGPASAGSLIATWTAPTTNEDGSPLTDLGGYRLYCGPGPGNYNTPVDVGNVTTYVLDVGPQDGTTVYCAVTAYDTSGNESVYSNEAAKVFPMLAPAAPAGLTVQ